MSEVSYYIDGVDLKTYGVYIKSSDGLLSRPKPKKRLSADWEGYNGEVIDLSKRYYESRKIKLECFIKATDPTDFITKCNVFQAVFDKAWTRRLSVSVEGNEPLVYEVCLLDDLDIKKTWHENIMVGTFAISLTEPEPVKKVLKYTRTGEGDKTVSITVTSTKLLNIYWGDGSHTFDVSGTAQTATHSYTTNGVFYIVVTGNIDEITSLTSTGTLVWNKL